VDRGVAESPDGERIAFGANRAGAYNVWRVGAEGSGPVQLTFGNGDLKPAFSPDGRWVIFQLVLVWFTNGLEVSVGGGEATQLTLTRAQ